MEATSICDGYGTPVAPSSWCLSIASPMFPTFVPCLFSFSKLLTNVLSSS